MTSVTSEELAIILDDKLEQKLAPFKSTFEDLKKTLEDTKELLNFTSKQYDTVIKRLRNENNNL